MSLYDIAAAICEQLKKHVNYTPDAAIILGSGLGSFADFIEKDYEINYSDIKEFPVSTVVGHAGKLVFGSVSGKKIVAMQGRFHLYEGYSVDQATLPIRIFQLMGIKTLIVTNASGGINPDFVPGDLMLITDHISLFCPSPLFGRNDERFGTRFPSMNEVYSRELTELADKAAALCGTQLKHGVYCYTKGPMYETPAEIKFISTCGADAVGMSTVPEAIVAVHGGLNVLGISCITNMAAGINATPLSHKEVMEIGAYVGPRFSKLIKTILEII